jgi:hypothetical protein
LKQEINNDFGAIEVSKDIDQYLINMFHKHSVKMTDGFFHDIKVVLGKMSIFTLEDMLMVMNDDNFRNDLIGDNKLKTIDRIKLKKIFGKNT